MRALFLGLCAINIVFFLWQLHGGGLDRLIGEPAINPQPKQIWLADELPDKRSPVVVPVFNYLSDPLEAAYQAEYFLFARQPRGWLPNHATAIPRSFGVARLRMQSKLRLCYEIGPFADETDAGIWLNSRKQQKKNWKIVPKTEIVPIGYVVYLRPNKAASQLANDKQTLSAKGINDFWVIPTGELQGAISLGVFSSEQRALVLKQQLADKGIEALVGPRNSEKQVVYAKGIVEQRLERQDNQTVALKKCQE